MTDSGSRDVYVLNVSSFLISRRGQCTKTDRIDVEEMTFTLRAYLASDHCVCRVVPAPILGVKDARAPRTMAFSG
uniref:hypothetical protein n=1 Tax=Sphingomonas sp. ERG5 TaxID=1381597 RepID=UPI00155DB045|nr:hypothetical protein [Sphingomonas sp. ERG5]